jgi:hypothetical protein
MLIVNLALNTPKPTMFPFCEPSCGVNEPFVYYVFVGRYLSGKRLVIFGDIEVVCHFLGCW